MKTYELLPPDPGLKGRITADLPGAVGRPTRSYELLPGGLTLAPASPVAQQKGCSCRDNPAKTCACGATRGARLLIQDRVLTTTYTSMQATRPFEPPEGFFRGGDSPDIWNQFVPQVLDPVVRAIYSWLMANAFREDMQRERDAALASIDPCDYYRQRIAQLSREVVQRWDDHDEATTSQLRVAAEACLSGPFTLGSQRNACDALFDASRAACNEAERFFRDTPPGQLCLDCPARATLEELNFRCGRMQRLVNRCSVDPGPEGNYARTLGCIELNKAYIATVGTRNTRRLLAIGRTLALIEGMHAELLARGCA